MHGGGHVTAATLNQSAMTKMVSTNWQLVKRQSFSYWLQFKYVKNRIFSKDLCDWWASLAKQYQFHIFFIKKSFICAVIFDVNAETWLLCLVTNIHLLFHFRTSFCHISLVRHSKSFVYTFGLITKHASVTNRITKSIVLNFKRAPQKTRFSCACDTKWKFLLSNSEIFNTTFF